MLRTKLVLLGLAATLVFSAVASSSAFAAAETRYFVEKTEVSAANALEGTSGLAKLESTIAGTKIIIECQKDAATGEIEKEGKSKGEIKFTECGELMQRNTAREKEKIAKCAVENITFKFIDLLVPGPGGSGEDEFKPASGSTFVTIVVGGTGCNATFKGSYEVEGTQICANPEGEVELVLHDIWCSSTGSKLKLHKELASFTSLESLQLTSHKKWS
ncbi:MAG: hypothetical protein ABSH36_09870 [Solirubrobacteraceae bacterium]